MELDREEKEILESFERGKWRSVPDIVEIERYGEYARRTLRKIRRINVKISEGDLIAIKKRAAEEGIPYQTLIASLIHKYVTGKIREVA
jgi:predicted DNA binding CopG/RHH family protein